MSIQERFWSKVKKGPACWVWQGHINKAGYGRFLLNRKVKNAHVVAFYLAGKELKLGDFVLHKCDFRACVNPGHLYGGSKKDNSQDMLKRKRYHRWYGENHPRAKLTVSIVKKIRSLYKPEIMTCPMLAVRFGVSSNTVWHIVANKLWRDC